MNTQFIFENIIFFPLLAAVVLAVYLIQFCSVISPCRIEFDEDSKREMKLMVRYNKLSDNAYAAYLGCIMAGVAVALIMESFLILVMLMIIQILYIAPAGVVMFAMYGRSKKYWEAYESGRQEKKPLTCKGVEIYN